MSITRLASNDSTENRFETSTQRQFNILEYLVIGLNNIKINVTNREKLGDN